MLKVGLIGRGSISKVHLDAYKKMEEEGTVKLCAVCDIRESQLSDLGDARLYTDIDEFFENEKDKLDFVDICLPTYLHKEVSIKAMELGIDVLCEKPMALNSDECQRMCETAKKTGKKLMIAQCNRFYGAARLMKKYIDNKELGKAYSAEFYREGGSMEPMGYNNWFRDENLSGGGIHDLHVHDVDLVNFFFGKPKAVSTVGINRISGAGFDAISTNYVYDDLIVNAKCDWTISHDKFNVRSFRVNFEKGYIFVDRTAGRNAFVKVMSDGTVEDLWDKLGKEMYYNEIVYFANCVANNLPCTECMPESTMDSIKIVEAEKKSAMSQGKKIIL